MGIVAGLEMAQVGDRLIEYCRPRKLLQQRGSNRHFFVADLSAAKA